MGRPHIKRSVKVETKKIIKELNNNPEKDADVLKYIKLIDIIRESRNKQKVNFAFEQIVNMLEYKIQQISRKFNIPGLEHKDVYQEALYALRYKAIKDYDPDRSSLREISPFDKFAILCIRRHLSTKLKASYQNKSRVLNMSISIDQDRSNHGDNDSEDSIFLSDILVQKHKHLNSDSVFELLNKQEYYKNLFSKLISKLSVFEKEVFILYCYRYSYEEIAEKINERRKPQEREPLKKMVKSIDNAISRLKTKSSIIYEEFQKDEE